MGTSARKERHRKQTRESILKTACEIARREGWPAVSVRKIADVIEYTPPILYEYFDSKDSLLDAIRKEGFARLKNDFQTIKELYRSPEKQLTEVALAIWNFAELQPEIFEVMFNLGGAYSQSKQTFQQELDYSDNPVWEMIAAFKPRFAEAVNKTFQEWWVVTYGFIAIKITVAPKESNGFTQSLYMENVRRYLRSIL
jgi:AcrR family transcriptional regulator